MASLAPPPPPPLPLVESTYANDILLAVIAFKAAAVAYSFCSSYAACSALSITPFGLTDLILVSSSRSCS
jgi:hypothetical protein